MKYHNHDRKVVAITGAGGFIGSGLLKKFPPDKYQVLSLSRSQPSFDKASNVTHIAIDLERKDVWKEVPIETIDVLIHMAAIDLNKDYDITSDIQVNALSVLNLLEHIKARNKNIKLIYTSSANIYGYSDGRCVDEVNPGTPLSLWSVHKQLAEKYIENYWVNEKVKSVILRLPNVFGIGALPEISDRVTLNRVIKKCLSSYILQVFSNRYCYRDYLHVSDVGEAICSALDNFDKLYEVQVFNLSNGLANRIIDVWEIIREYCEIKTGKNIPILESTEPISPFELRNYRLDSSRFKNLTNWSPKRNLRESIKETVDYYWDELERTKRRELFLAQQ
jgi:nucleoside-diphosphate-sugar epimerase